MGWLRSVMLKYEPLEERFSKHSKTSDYLQRRHRSYQVNFMNSKTDLDLQLKSLIHISSVSKSFYPKTQALVIKYVQPNKIFVCLLAKSVD
jgi:hypothetical protein